MNYQPVTYIPDHLMNDIKYPYRRAYPWHYDLHQSKLFHNGLDRIPFNYYQYPITLSKSRQFLDYNLNRLSINNVNEHPINSLYILLFIGLFIGLYFFKKI